MIQTAQTNLEYTTITAPSDGRIGVRLVDPGNIVACQRRRIARDAGAHAAVSRDVHLAGARSRRRPRRDGAGPVEVIAFDQDNRRALATGKLLLVDNLDRPGHGDHRLKAMFPNKDEKLWPGEFVNARVLLETRTNVLVVPSAAVQRGPNGLFIWIVNGNGVAEPRTIEIGPSVASMTIVTSGLTGGERIVTDGQYKLQRGAPVTYASPAAAGSGRNS